MTNDSLSFDEKVLELSDLVKNITIPIQISDQYNQKYFTIPVSLDNLEYRLYINTNAQSYTTCDKFIWDYFASGELYFALPENLQIVSVKSSFVSLYHRLISTSSALSKHPEDANKSYGIAASLINSSLGTTVNSVPSPTASDTFAWSFDVNVFFNLEEVKESSNKVSLDPICKYFTLKNNVLDITSKEFAFANRPSNIPICSSPNLTQPNQISPCSFFSLNMKQRVCPYYEYHSTDIHSTKITPKNSSDDFSITLQYSTAVDSSHIFKIINNFDSTEISSFSYTSDYSYEDIIPQAIAVYEEYIDCYQDHDLSKNSLDEKLFTETKISYIETLIGN